MLLFNEVVEKKIAFHAESAYPHECVGFFFGFEQEEKRIITAVIPADNVVETNKEKKFLVDPLDYLKAERYALDNKLSFLGIYHSHPDHPAVPSIHDLKSAQPYFSYIIVSVNQGNTDEIRSWRLSNLHQFIEEPVKLERFEESIQNQSINQKTEVIN